MAMQAQRYDDSKVNADHAQLFQHRAMPYGGVKRLDAYLQKINRIIEDALEKQCSGRLDTLGPRFSIPIPISPRLRTRSEWFIKANSTEAMS
jgi:hypothetical protein